ncbi:MAG TPA: cytochrome c [Phenylobacterium sp.]|jgi:mono/diheme cytochrome c family protein|uniref:cytochrome c n=1 Tax=Phenylobacterium sp. TaxID=1871053 RepID=UPI002B5D626E|nr:cytochrome c [Phenylobacterium sp.]HXA38254.1 cytochrome c [Phenylobacterium sp.]
MLRRGLIVVGALAVVVAIALWVLTAPKTLPASELTAGYHPDLANGQAIFTAGNCSACHMTPGQDDRAQLAGGLKLKSPFGTFVTPNISSDKQFGIGGWTEAQFANAMKRGTGRHGEHLYPAFPYPAYSLMKTSDVRDLFAYLQTLPAIAKPTAPHALKFPYGLRPEVGFWKLLFFKPHEFAPDPKQSAAWNRGAYLSEGPAHCAECHTPRNALGGMETGQLYAGAPNLEAGGRFANNITPSKDGIGDWSEQDIADFLKSGTDKCFNEPTGMKDVIASTGKLSDADVTALATYIHALPPRAGNGKKKTC